MIASDTNGAKRTVQHFGKYAYLLSCRKSEKTDTIVMSALGTISHCRLEFNPLKHRHKSIPLASSNLMGEKCSFSVLQTLDMSRARHQLQTLLQKGSPVIMEMQIPVVLG